MKPASVSLGPLLAAASAAAFKCKADRCARAVTETLPARHLADCEDYLACTVTPAPRATTVTKTLGAAEAGETGKGKEKRDYCPYSPPVTHCPYAVPAYAGAYCGPGAYSSACDCFGAAKSTVTLPASACTVTLYITTTQEVAVTDFIKDYETDYETATRTDYTTATVTDFETATVTETASSSCHNEGLQWAYYDYPNTGEDGGDDYDPAVVKTLTPDATGVTNFLAVPQGQNIYGATLDQNTFILDHRGYIHAPETGTYTFQASNIDDVIDMWLGPFAYSGWSKNNAQQIVPYSNGQGTYQITLVAGSFNPFRLTLRNLGGPVSMDYAVTGPSGQVIIGSDASTTQKPVYAIQYSCDGFYGPRFQPYGQET